MAIPALAAGALLAGAGALGNFGLNLGASAISNSQSMKNAQAMAALQFAYAKQYAQYTGTHAHQWEVQDLRNAGLNPILSANSGQTYSGSSGFGSGAPSMASPQIQADIMQNALAVRSTVANIENMSANTMKQQKESELIGQHTEMTILQKMQQQNLNKISELEAQLKEQNLPYEHRKSIAQALNEEKTTQEILSRTAKNKAELGLIKSQQSLNESSKALRYAETKYTNERSRGFTASETFNASSSLGAGPAKHSRSEGWTHSKSW